MSIVSGNIGQLEKKMTNKLQAVREAVISAVPSILELEFGCVVRHGTGERTILGYSSGIDKFIVWNGIGFEPVEGADMRHISKEILGRKITLADVLAAIEKGVGDWYSVSGAGRFWKSLNDKELRTEPVPNASWNLLDDDLNHQTPETISFLYEILCTKKVG